MNSIPLIKGNTPQEINTSIIALKKALSELEAQDRLLQGTDKDVQDKIKQINELIEGINTHLGTVDTHLSAIDGQITALHPVDTVTSGNMHSVTSNAVAEALKYKDDWQTNQIIETDKFFQGFRLKNYLASTVNQTSGIYYFNLPEVLVNIIDVHINVEDENNNVISDGYSDGPYTLAWAYIKADNTIRVVWGGWTILRSITMFLTYR